MAWGPDDVLAAAAEDPARMVIRTTLHYLGPVGELVINVLLITSMFACVLSFHNVHHPLPALDVERRRAARPASARVAPQAPLAAHLVARAERHRRGADRASFAVLGLDPVLQVFTWFAGVATLAHRVLMALTSLAVIVYFARTKQDSAAVEHGHRPGLGFIGLVGSAVVIIALNFPMLRRRRGRRRHAGVRNHQRRPARPHRGLPGRRPRAGRVPAASRPAAYADVTDAIAG